MRHCWFLQLLKKHNFPSPRHLPHRRKRKTELFHHQPLLLLKSLHSQLLPNQLKLCRPVPLKHLNHAHASDKVFRPVYPLASLLDLCRLGQFS